MVEDEAQKKAIAEKLQVSADEVSQLEFMDGAGRIKHKTKPPKQQTPEDKMMAEFKLMVRK